MQRQIQKKSFVFKIIVSELVELICLSLLRRKYLSLAVNMLTNSLTILHSIKIDFLQLNLVHSDQ